MAGRTVLRVSFVDLLKSALDAIMVVDVRGEIVLVKQTQRDGVWPSP